MPEISVIIPTHNCIKYLPVTLGSVFNQTYTDFEIIIIDNGSTDNTPEWVKNLNDKRIKYYYQENTGCPSGSRNRGIDIASGKFIAFLDSDDLWEKEKLEKQIKLFENQSVGLAYTGLKFIDAEGNPTGASRFSFFKGKVLEHLIKNNFVSSSSVMIRKNVLDENNLRFRTGRKGTEDWDLWLRLAYFTEFDFADEQLLKYRKYSTSISQNGELMFNSRTTTLNEIGAFIKEKNERQCQKLFSSIKKSKAVGEFCYAFWLYKNNRKKEALYMLFSAFRHDFSVLWDYFLSIK